MNKAIRFELKRPSSDQPTAIRLIYYCADGKLKYYTGQSVLPSLWPDKIDTGTKAQIRRITGIVSEAVVDFKIKGEPLTMQNLRARIDNMMQREGMGRTVDYFAEMSRVIDRMEAGEILTPQKKIYSPGSIKTFQFTAGFLQKFRPGMTVSGVTMITYHEFITYCQKLDFSTNYIGAQIKNWKTLGKAIGGNDIYDTAAFKKIQEEAYDVYLDEDELGAMMEAELSNRLAVARDWFILDCYTGLRVSDLISLSDRNFTGEFITIANEKTDDKVVIPVHPRARMVIDRYGGPPPRITDVELNRSIKQVARIAGIDHRVLHTITKGGKRVDRYLEKWQMISAHTARRSFVTNMRKNKVPDTIVMKLTGIRSAGTLKKYDKLSQEEAASIAAGLEFFNSPG